VSDIPRDAKRNLSPEACHFVSILKYAPMTRKSRAMRKRGEYDTPPAIAVSTMTAVRTNHEVRTTVPDVD
jgi:hypothetical protein